jgi:hypothetical protein
MKIYWQKKHAYTRKMEPDWTKSIPNWAICNWFYVIFIADVVVFSILILSVLFMLFAGKGSRVLLGSRLIMYLISAALSLTGALFIYLLCDRSLRPK